MDDKEIRDIKTFWIIIDGENGPDLICAKGISSAHHFLVPMGLPAYDFREVIPKTETHETPEAAISAFEEDAHREIRSLEFKILEQKRKLEWAEAQQRPDKVPGPWV